MQDRVPLYPGRVTLTPVAGQENTFDMVRADQPTQEGTPLNKETLLKDGTAALLGLGTDAVPDDAFVALILGQGIYGYRIRVQFADGTPVEGATITGIEPLTGSTLVTGADGTVLGKSASANVTINCTSPYIDQKAPTAQTVTKTGTITNVTLTLENISDMLTVSSSKTTKISQMAKAIDIFASGGGGGGGYGVAGGGGGGYADNKLNVPTSGSTDLEIVIGSGGSSGSESSFNGGNGGKTSVSIGNTIVLTASGGVGGTNDGGAGNQPGGEGNGPGGTGSYKSADNGSSASVYVFNDATIGIKTGGGGGGGARNTSRTQGGSPNGGRSGYYESLGRVNAGESGGVGGGGGGGSAGYNGEISYGGNGGPGIVYLRFHF